MPKKTASADWRWKRLQDRLDAAGWTLTRLAEHHGVSLTTLTNAKYGPYPASERRLAEAIGVHPSTIWPSRYHPDGRHRGKGEERHRQKGRKVAEKSTPIGTPINVNMSLEVCDG